MTHRTLATDGPTDGDQRQRQEAGRPGFVEQYRDKFIDEKMLLDDGRQISQNADPESLLGSLKFSKSLEAAFEPCKIKKNCEKCQKQSKLMCYHCGDKLVETGVLPDIELPAELYV